MLSVTLGLLPYLVLSTTGPLIQQWFSKAMGRGHRIDCMPCPMRRRYSLCSRILFNVEPNFHRKTQATVWGIGFVVYVVCCGICAVKMFSKRFWPGRKAGLIGVV